MAAGLLVISFAVAVGIGGAWRERQDRERLEEVFRSTNIPQKRSSINPSGDLAILRVERLNWSVIVRPTASEQDLSRGAGWIPGTALPAQPGNAAIAGHRDTFFRALRNFRIGDEIVVSTAERTVTYVVTETRIVKPDQVEVISPTRETSLTLVTCYPFHLVGRAPKRFIVRAYKKQRSARTG